MGRVVVITGTRKGIGKELAQHFLGLGDKVAGLSRRESSIEHSNYVHFRADVTDEEAVVRTIREIRKHFDGIDVLINNAGIAAMNHLLVTPAKTARQVMETNFLGTFFFLREVGKVMMRQGGGRIVNFTTVAVPMSLDGEAIYAASKAAVEALTKIAARELAEYKITVNAVGPTPIKTDLIKLVPEGKIQSIIDRQSIRRFGEFRDVVNVIDFFVKPESDFVTGQVIYLGGIHA